MSTDFTGNNSHITNDSLLKMVSDTLVAVAGSTLSATRDEVYAFYASKGLGDAALSSSWGYYDRYTEGRFNSNDYTGNKFTDIQVLSACVDDKAFEDRSDETVESRKAKIKDLLSTSISVGRCSDLNGLVSYFPHLDKPYEVTQVSGQIGYIPCIRDGYEMLTPVVSYTDSCGLSSIAPIPTFPLDGRPDVALLTVLGTDQYFPAELSATWTVTANADQIFIKDGISNMPSIEVAALSTAILTGLTAVVNLEY